MSYTEKLDFARAIVEEHNSNLSEENDKIDFDGFLNSLKKAGGTTDSSLKVCSWESLQKFGLPELIAHQVARVFRGKDDTQRLSFNRVKMMTPRELLDHYEPSKKRNPVYQRLEKECGNKKFIVFNNDETVNVDASVKILNDLDDGFPEIDTVEVDGIPQKVYRVGEQKSRYVNENPLYTGRPLRSDDVCDQTGRSWQGVSMYIRQLVRIAALETLEIDFSGSIQKAHDILDKIMSKEWNEQSLKRRCPKASTKLDELKEIGKEPILRIKLGDNPQKAKNDPFTSSNRVY